MGEERFIFGRRAVSEALSSGLAIREIWIQPHVTGSVFDEIRKKAEAVGVRIKPADGKKLDEITRRQNHQGVLAWLEQSAFAYQEWEAIFQKAGAEKPLVAVLDEITDPHNLGAIIRSAECAGFHGVVIPKHRSAEVNATVVKTSAGAAAHIPIIQVTNLTQALEKLKEAGLWIYGAAMVGDRTYDQMDGKDAVAIVIGSEGKGLRKMIAEHCDFLITIPMFGKVASLNASVAAGILFFEMRKKREGK